MKELLKNNIAKIPNFPKEGILFYDISPLLMNPDAWQKTISHISTIIKKMNPDILVGLESRGFFVASPLAIELGIGFTMVRKQGKLPGEVLSHKYELEYGSAVFEIQKNIIKPNSRVVILDDLLATGGTINAAYSLLNQVGAKVVGAVCIIELEFLNGRKNLHPDIQIETLISFNK